MLVCTSVSVAQPLPRHGESDAADLAASHTGLDGAILSIEGARTDAHAISTGAVAVFRAFQRAQPGVDRSRRARGASAEAASRRCDPHPNLSFVCRIHIADVYVTKEQPSLPFP